MFDASIYVLRVYLYCCWSLVLFWTLFVAFWWRFLVGGDTAVYCYHAVISEVDKTTSASSLLTWSLKITQQSQCESHLHHLHFALTPPPQVFRWDDSPPSCPAEFRSQRSSQDRGETGTKQSLALCAAVSEAACVFRDVMRTWWHHDDDHHDVIVSCGQALYYQYLKHSYRWS